MNKSTEDRFASGFRGEKKLTVEDGEENKPDVAVVIAPGGDSEGGPNATPAATAGAEGGADNPDAGLHGEMPMGGDMMGEGEGGENLSPEDQQREASWKGRLKKMEDELKARAAELDSREAAMSSSPSPQAHNEAAEPASEEAAETPAMEAAENNIDVEDITPSLVSEALAAAPADIKAAVETFTQDFGEDYIITNLRINAYFAQYFAGLAANAAMGPLKAEADDLRGTLQAVIDGFNTMHQGDLEDQEPEFEQVVNSPEFEQWVTSQEPDNQSRIVRALQGGSASRIVRILTQFKDSLKQNAEPAAGSVDTSALDAAAGVRSSGVSVPDTSAAGGSPEDAFARGFYGKTRK